jgi:hypothetical protein
MNMKRARGYIGQGTDSRQCTALWSYDAYAVVTCAWRMLFYSSSTGCCQALIKCIHIAMIALMIEEVSTAETSGIIYQILW